MSWRTLTSDPQILSIISGYKISFLKTPFQKSQPFTQASGQATIQSFGGKMATASESFYATCVVYGTCSAILNILKSERISPKRNLLCENTEV